MSRLAGPPNDVFPAPEAHSLSPLSPSQTLALRECMLQHKDYYAPLLEEEEEIAAANAEAEKVRAESGSTHQQGAGQEPESAGQEPEGAEAQPAE